MTGPNPAWGTREGDAERGSGHCGDATLVLLRHCHDMKRQEMWLRLVTLLLLLLLFTCAGFFFCSDAAGSRTRHSSGEHASTEEQRAVHLKQESRCPSGPATTENGNNSGRFNIQLTSLYDNTRQTVKWTVETSNMPEQYKEEERAIEIPQSGVYFIYVRFRLSCHNPLPLEFSPLFVKFNRWNKNYGAMPELMEFKDGLTCPTEYRDVFMGQLFNVTRGDHVSVMVGKGYDLITLAHFGAHLT